MKIEGNAPGGGGVSSSGPPQRYQTQPTYRPSPGPFIPILVDERDGPYADGTYSFNFETGNGISRNEKGYPGGPEGAVVSSGGWSFTFPDGTPAVFTFEADGDGYRPVSNLIPTPHPLPAHAIEQIEFARRNPTPASRPAPYRPF
ncbi:LOW QUALITY PROTEIN: cuticle protein AM1199-like [Scylla paramamosain]|uniref:LOW QUALITY PROTEIN: cuticle protein AM1199-like n=1 Tax=Scylla paramamosain TaxID=85552 RepID=UPI003082E136